MTPVSALRKSPCGPLGAKRVCNGGAGTEGVRWGYTAWGVRRGRGVGVWTGDTRGHTVVKWACENMAGAMLKCCYCKFEMGGGESINPAAAAL